MEIIEEFGRSVVLKDGALDRKAIGSAAFSDPARLKRLNAITHPRIRELIYREISAIDQRDGDPLIVVDAALLIETGLFTEMDAVVVVYAGEDEQMERLMKRDGLSEAEAGKRISAQMPIREKTRYADHVIDNSGPATGTVEETRRLYERLRAEAKKGKKRLTVRDSGRDHRGDPEAP
jgi:dephospho-CoA kinase